MNGWAACMRGGYVEHEHVDGIDLIVPSVRNAERNKVTALQAGADDNLIKPFGAAELVAGTQVSLRHVAQSQPPLGPIVDAGDLAVDVTRNHVTRDGAMVHLTPTEYELLRMLIANGGRVLTHATLLRTVWG